MKKRQDTYKSKLHLTEPEAVVAEFTDEECMEFFGITLAELKGQLEDMKELVDSLPDAYDRTLH